MQQGKAIAQRPTEETGKQVKNTSKTTVKKPQAVPLLSRFSLFFSKELVVSSCIPL